MQQSIPLPFGDGEYQFRLSWAGASEIERKSNATILVIFDRVMNGQASLSDIVETIRQGLIGGEGGVVDASPVDTPPHVVNSLLERYVTGPEREPLADSLSITRAVLSAFVVGYAPAQKKSGDAGEETPE